MSVVNQTKLDPSLNYRQLDSSKSSPMWRKLYPANGGSRTISLSTDGALQNVIFNIPTECVNMGHSYFEYKYRVPAQGAGTYSWIYKDKHGEFDSIMYRDTGSQTPVDVKNFHLYQELTNRLNFSGKYLEYNDPLNGLTPTNAPLTDVKCIRFDGTTCSVPFKEPQPMAMVNAGGAANTASAYIYKKIYLKDLIPDSWFGLAKNQIMPVETYLDVNFSNGAGRIGYTSTSAVNTNVNPLAFAVSDDTAVKFQIEDLCLNLCVETNQELVKLLKMEVAKGLTLPIPVVRMHVLRSGAAATSYVYNLPLDNKQHGRKLKRIIYAPFSTAGTANLLYDHQNTAAARKIASYQTELDNQKLQRDILYFDPANGKYDDYMNHKALLNDNLIFNQSVYSQNWVHVDSWSYEDKATEQIGGGAIMVDGLNLDKPMTWTMNVFECDGPGVNRTYNNTVAVVGLKMLVINPTSFIVA